MLFPFSLIDLSCMIHKKKVFLSEGSKLHQEFGRKVFSSYIRRPLHETMWCDMRRSPGTWNILGGGLCCTAGGCKKFLGMPHGPGRCFGVWRRERISVSHRNGKPENDRPKRTIGDVTRRVCLWLYSLTQLIPWKCFCFPDWAVEWLFGKFYIMSLWMLVTWYPFCHCGAMSCSDKSNYDTLIKCQKQWSFLINSKVQALQKSFAKENKMNLR